MTDIFERKDLKIILVPKDGDGIEITPKIAQFSGLLNTALSSNTISENEVEIPVNITAKQLTFIVEYLRDLADNKVSRIRETVRIPNFGESLESILRNYGAYDKYIVMRHYTNENLCSFLAVANYLDIPSLISLICAYLMMIIAVEIRYIDMLLGYNNDPSISLDLKEKIDTYIKDRKIIADPISEDKEGELKITKGSENLFNSLFKSDENSLKLIYNVSYVLFTDGYLVATRYYFNSDRSLYGYAESIKPPPRENKSKVSYQSIKIESKVHNFLCTEVDSNTLIGYDMGNQSFGRTIVRSDLVHQPTGRLVGRTIDDIVLMYRYQDTKEIKLPSNLSVKTDKNTSLSYRRKKIISKLMECRDFPIDLIPFCLKYDVPNLPKYNLNPCYICPGPMGDFGVGYNDTNIVVNNHLIQNGYDISNKYRIIATKITGKNSQTELIPYRNEEKVADEVRNNTNMLKHILSPGPLKRPSVTSCENDSKGIINNDTGEDEKINAEDTAFQIDNRYYILSRRRGYTRRIYVWDINELSRDETKTKNSDYDFDIEEEEYVSLLSGSNGIIISNESYDNGLLAYTVKGKHIYIPNIDLDEFTEVTSKYWLATDAKNEDKYLVDISSIESGSIRKYKIPSIDYNTQIIKVNETTLQFFVLDDSSDEKNKEYYLYTFTDGKLSKKKLPFFSENDPILNPKGGNNNNKYKIYLSRYSCYIFDVRNQTTIMKEIDIGKLIFNSDCYYVNDELIVLIEDTGAIWILNMTNGSISKVVIPYKGTINFIGGLSDGTFFIQSNIGGIYAVTLDGTMFNMDYHPLYSVIEVPSLNRVVALVDSDPISSIKCFAEIWC